MKRKEACLWFLGLYNDGGWWRIHQHQRDQAFEKNTGQFCTSTMRGACKAWTWVSTSSRQMEKDPRRQGGVRSHWLTVALVSSPGPQGAKGPEWFRKVQSTGRCDPDPREALPTVRRERAPAALRPRPVRPVRMLRRASPPSRLLPAPDIGGGRRRAGIGVAGTRRGGWSGFPAAGGLLGGQGGCGGGCRRPRAPQRPRGVKAKAEARGSEEVGGQSQARLEAAALRPGAARRAGGSERWPGRLRAKRWKETPRVRRPGLGRRRAEGPGGPSGGPGGRGPAGPGSVKGGAAPPASHRRRKVAPGGPASLSLCLSARQCLTGTWVSFTDDQERG